MREVNRVTSGSSEKTEYVYLTLAITQNSTKTKGFLKIHKPTGKTGDKNNILETRKLTDE